MKRQYPLFIVIIALLGALGCSHDDPAQPESGDLETADWAALDADKCGHDLLVPDGYYSMFFTEETGNYSEFSRIKTRDGRAGLLWHLQFIPGGDGQNSFGWTPFGFAFDMNGTMYMTHNILAFDPLLVQSQFARVDSETGEVFPIGDPVPFNTSGGDIDSEGNFYVCGFEVPALGYIWGNDNLYRVDKETGEFIEVGPTGHTHWMDLAFDSEDVLWGTFDNEMYIIDTETGASTLMCEIQDVPDAGEPRFMEIMSIAFTADDVLYGTGLTVYWLHPEGSPVMRIDPYTGESELLGYSQTSDYNHGGDIMPSHLSTSHHCD